MNNESIEGEAGSGEKDVEGGDSIVYLEINFVVLLLLHVKGLVLYIRRQINALSRT